MVRKIKVLLSVIFVFLLVAAVSAQAGQVGGRKGMRPSSISSKVNIVANGLYYVRVTRVIDGDTIEVALNSTHTEKVRLIGVDTPDNTRRKNSSNRYSKNASDFTKSELLNKKVWLSMDTQLRDRNRQLLGYIWTEKPNNAENQREVRSKMFNAQLIIEGYADVMISSPNDKYEEMFKRFNREARNDNKGHWRNR